jgi:regulator of sirC expression with transglutaminase-like and TPR domain
MFQKKWQSICEKREQAYEFSVLAQTFYDVEYLFTVDENVLFHQKNQV